MKKKVEVHCSIKLSEYSFHYLKMRKMRLMHILADKANCKGDVGACDCDVLKRVNHVTIGCRIEE